MEGLREAHCGPRGPSMTGRESQGRDSVGVGIVQQ